MNWYKEANQRGFEDVAECLGMTKTKNAWGPCPKCNTCHRSDKDKRPPIGVAGDVSWKCFSCDAKGDIPILISYSLFQKSTKQLNSDDYESLNEWLRDNNFDQNPKQRTKKVKSNLQFQSPPDKYNDFAWRDGLAIECKERLHSKDGIAVLNYLILNRKIGRQVIENADLGCLRVGSDWYLSIPLKDKDGEIINIRFRSIPPAKKAYRVCAGRPLPLYGAESLGDKKVDVLVVEGELDVLALRTYGFNENVVSGTSGATANWPDEW